MKKAVFTAIIACLLPVALSAALGSEFTLYGNVYNYDNTSGTAAAPNSFASLNAYRAGIPGEIGHQNNGESGLYPNKIYAADYSSGDPAYYFTDVQNNWTTAVAPGQSIYGVVETYSPENGWGGGPYVGCSQVDFYHPTAAAASLPDLSLKEIPAPSIAEETVSYIRLTFTGMDIDFALGYSIYRKAEPYGSYGLITRVPQARNAEVSYTDSTGLSAGQGYTYKVAVNFQWGGGNGAPDYFETNARSAASGIAQLASIATPTFTPTYTMTPMPPTPTATPTPAINPELVKNVQAHKLIVFDNPVRNGKLRAAFDAGRGGTARVYLYNINAELARNFVFAAKEGVNLYEEILGSISPGLYILRVVIENGDGKENLPVRKVAIIR